MFSTLFKVTGFKRALDLFESGQFEEGKAVLKSLQDEFLAICDENEALKGQLSEVAEVLDLAEKVKFDGQKYWLTDDGQRKGPFCQVCYDRDGLLVHLHEHENHWECQSCQGLYMIPRKAEANRKEKPYLRTALKKTIPLFLEQELG
ncbi:MULTISPECIES: hypothetical protein [unclassified Pseudodesulfovibrio]|uniref:hypothetical protein n=1 Tax=unclassified Pseudodesulfovibrio TaxID=2661612 RepID=UPI000FEBE844|nr:MULTISPECIES: hypothetical protein [unclassified Pseudodesulfovibrio]MCJ2164243.1 hypothetical protein [Pseudodesulfovibrio sp. S3-i]RWU05134.1 hypothetical protein DWB63_05620 [Pseudodesulfovibrio sp. S3]